MAAQKLGKGRPPIKVPIKNNHILQAYVVAVWMAVNATLPASVQILGTLFHIHPTKMLHLRAAIVILTTGFVQKMS